MSNTTIDNTDDTIDSSDVITRIEELESDYQDLLDTLEAVSEAIVEKESELEEAMQDDDSIPLRIPIAAELVDLKIEQENKTEEAAGWKIGSDGLELEALKDLASQGENSADDWSYGAQLIRDSYFEKAMDEMIGDCYDFGKDLPSWVTISYDYDALKQDYTSVDFDGETYWVR
jgi:hypothetical protein